MGKESGECYDHNKSVEAKVENEMTKGKESVVRTVNEDTVVINSEEQFNSKRTSNSAPVKDDKFFRSSRPPNYIS